MCDFKSILKKALKEKKHTDAKFMCPQENSPGKVVVEAHKTFLMLASPVFEAMFSPETEKYAVSEKIIEIIDIHANAFKALINIIYGENVKKGSILMAVELYYAGEKYDITKAKVIATKFIKQHLLNVDNVIPIYELCVNFGNDECRNFCIKRFEDNTHSILLTASFLTCRPSTLVKIFSLNKLHLRTEYTLIWAYSTYLAMNPQAKDEIAKALEHIRFLTLHPNDLLRINFFDEKVLMKIIRIALFYEPEIAMPLNLSTSRTLRLGPPMQVPVQYQYVYYAPPLQLLLP